MRPNQAGLGLAQIRPAEDGDAAQADLGRWLTLTELAAETGRRLEGVRSWAKRGARAGRIRTRKTNRGEVQVWATAELEPGAAQADRSADLGRDEAEPRLQARVEELLERATRAEAKAAGLWDEAGRWRGKAEEAGQRASRAEGELAAEQRRSAELRADLEHERSERTKVVAELAEARRPWLAKVLDGLRRKGS